MIKRKKLVINFGGSLDCGKVSLRKLIGQVSFGWILPQVWGTELLRVVFTPRIQQGRFISVPVSQHEKRHLRWLNVSVKVA